MSDPYLLDTNIVSHLVRSHPQVTKRIVDIPMERLVISTITEAELLYGLARRPAAKKLHRAVYELLLRVEIVAWDRSSAASYGTLRARLEGEGRSIDALDLLIASQALARNAVLVTADGALAHLPGLTTEDWTAS